MRYRRISVGVGLLGLLAVLGSVALYPQTAVTPAIPFGASYLTTIKDSTGAFASRSVIALHADHTISVIDSGQVQTGLQFSSQLGTWGRSEQGLIGRTIDFTYVPGPTSIARGDYTFKFGPGGEVSGTIALYSFPLQADPQGSGGTLIGTFTFVGQQVLP